MIVDIQYCYISNQKAYGVYESGDEITILGLKIYEVDDF